MVRRLVILLVLVAGCTQASGDEIGLDRATQPSATATTAPTAATTTAAPTTTAPPATTTPSTAAQAPAPGPTTAAPPVARARTVHEQPYTPFAIAGGPTGVTLHHPSARVERIGFHQSGHDGARLLEPLPGAAPHLVLESRDRGTGATTAADVVVDPDAEIRAPVTGTVKRAGGYVLYCDHRDDFAVIAPDTNPGWEVKLLHINGVQVEAGDRVVAGETVVAPRPTRLPFESQVEETAAKPPWPHVHIEVVDPSIPDRPSGRGCP